MGNPSIDALDPFDLKLLRLLSKDSRQTGEALSAQVGLSPASCLRRVQRLRKIGAIEREIAIVSPAVMGTPVRVIAMLTLRRGGPDRVERLKTKLLALPAVDQIWHVTGPKDFVVNVRCASMEAYAEFAEQHFYDDRISGFDSLVVLREHTNTIDGLSR